MGQSAGPAAAEAWHKRALGLRCVAGHTGLPQIKLPLAITEGEPVCLLIATRSQDRLLLALARELLDPLRTGPRALA